MLRSLMGKLKSRPVETRTGKTPAQPAGVGCPAEGKARPAQALISPEEFKALSARHEGEFDKDAYAEDLAQMVSNAMRARMNS